MSEFIPGQRWISDGEAELGLGTILNCDARSVTVLFGASQETRTYSTRLAPLTRVAFGSGDRHNSQLDDWRFRKRRGVQLEAVVAQRIAETPLGVADVLEFGL